MASPFIADQIQTNKLISSGTLQISGSITRLENNTSYLVAGDNIIISSGSSGQITLSVSTGSNNTLDQSYDQGGTGLGAVITVDGQPVQLQGTAGNGSITLAITGSIYSNAFTGSLTKLTDGTSFIAEGTSVTVASASNGQITITAAGSTAITGSFTVGSSATKFLRLDNDGTDTFISASAGAIYIAPGGNSGFMYLSSSSGRAATLAIQSETGNTSLVDLTEGLNSRLQLKADNAREQALIGIHSDVMRKLIITDTTLVNKDHDHALAAHPTIVLHSITNPDTNNTQWISLACDVSNGVIDTGANRNIRLSGSGHFGYATQRTGSVALNALSFDYAGGGFSVNLPSNISGTAIPYIQQTFGGRRTAVATVPIPVGVKIINAKAGVSITNGGDFALMRVNVTGSAWNTASVIGNVMSDVSGAQDLRIDNLNYNTSPDGGEQYYVIVSVIGSDEHLYGAQVSYVYNDLRW